MAEFDRSVTLAIAKIELWRRVFHRMMYKPDKRLELDALCDMAISHARQIRKRRRKKPERDTRFDL